jgi:hypothetical protein
MRGIVRSLGLVAVLAVSTLTAVTAPAVADSQAGSVCAGSRHEPVRGKCLYF